MISKQTYKLVSDLLSDNSLGHISSCLEAIYEELWQNVPDMSHAQQTMWVNEHPISKLIANRFVQLSRYSFNNIAFAYRYLDVAVKDNSCDRGNCEG